MCRGHYHTQEWSGLSAVGIVVVAFGLNNWIICLLNVGPARDFNRGSELLSDPGGCWSSMFPLDIWCLRWCALMKLFFLSLFSPRGLPHGWIPECLCDWIWWVHFVVCLHGICIVWMTELREPYIVCFVAPCLRGYIRPLMCKKRMWNDFLELHAGVCPYVNYDNPVVVSR